VMSLTDIHDYLQVQNQLSHLVATQQNMLDASQDCIKIITPEGRLCHLNQAGRQALGLQKQDQVTDLEWLALLPEEVRPVGKRALKRAKQGLNTRFSGKSQLKDQPTEYWDNLLTPVVDEHNITQQVLCVARNVSQQKQVEMRLKPMMERDELTGLYNRRAFYKLFNQALLKARQQQQQVGLLLIHLDYFKHVNDSLGHVAGDHLLHVLGARFQNNLGHEAIISRLGGDEFAILVNDLDNESQLLHVAQRVCQQIDIPINYAGTTISGG